MSQRMAELVCVLAPSWSVAVGSLGAKVGQVSVPEAHINLNAVHRSVAVGTVGAADVHCCWRSTC